MTHEELREKLLELAYGELSPRAARRIEEHAASCDACRAELGRIRETRRLMSLLPEEPAPAAGERILFAAAREAARRRDEPQRALARWLWGGSIVALSLAAVAAVSYRVLSAHPKPSRDDANALMGESPYARPPQRDAAPPGHAQEEPEPRNGTARRGIAAPAPEPAPAPHALSRAAKSPAPAAPQAAPEKPATRQAAPGAAAPALESAAPSPEAAARAQARPTGRSRAEERSFPGCTRELWRRVERDPDGRVASYAWEERVGTRRLRFEVTYGPDGRVLRKRAYDAATGAPGPGEFDVPPAASVDLDAPVRCE